MTRVMAPGCIKTGLWKCLKAGTGVGFPDQGTPQGGVISPLLANIALDGIEKIHPSIRYADDMVIFLKPGEDAQKILDRIAAFLAERKLEIKQEKTRVVASTDGFDFLGWHFKVKPNGKLTCCPSKDNYQAFRSKVKFIVINSNYGAEVKAQKLAPIVRGWRQYHRYCDMTNYCLWGMQFRAFTVFNREKNQTKHSSETLVKKAFPTVKWSVFKHIKVAGDRSPFDGDNLYWSKRESNLYNNLTVKVLKKQDHSCAACGHKFLPGDVVELHHIDGNHYNWKPGNLEALHRECHQYTHMSKG